MGSWGSVSPILGDFISITITYVYIWGSFYCFSFQNSPQILLNFQGLSQWNPVEGGQKENKSQRGRRTLWEEVPLSKCEQSSSELTETEAECTDPARVCTRYFVHVLWLPVYSFPWIPKWANTWVSSLCLFLGTFTSEGLSCPTLMW